MLKFYNLIFYELNKILESPLYGPTSALAY